MSNIADEEHSDSTQFLEHLQAALGRLTRLLLPLDHKRRISSQTLAELNLLSAWEDFLVGLSQGLPDSIIDPSRNDPRLDRALGTMATSDFEPEVWAVHEEDTDSAADDERGWVEDGEEGEDEDPDSEFDDDSETFIDDDAD